MSARFACLLGVLLAAGCTKPSPNPPLAEKDKPTTPGAASPQAAAADPNAAVAAGLFVKDFLTAVHAGTATAAQLTPQFKKVVAEPVFDADKQLGYSDSVADNWLKQYRGKLPSFTTSSPGTDGDAAFFTGTVPAEKPVQLAVRLVKSGGGWIVDWLSVAEVGPVTLPADAAPTFAAAAFLAALLAGNDTQAAGLMALETKKQLAPPFGGETRPYSPGILKTKLDGYRGPFTGFTIAKADGNIVTGELTGAAGKKAFALTLVPGERPFDRLVADVKID
jgi:hypothetical protein